MKAKPLTFKAARELIAAQYEGMTDCRDEAGEIRKATCWNDIFSCLDEAGFNHSDEAMEFVLDAIAPDEKK